MKLPIVVLLKYAARPTDDSHLAALHCLHKYTNNGPLYYNKCKVTSKMTSHVAITTDLNLISKIITYNDSNRHGVTH